MEKQKLIARKIVVNYFIENGFQPYWNAHAFRSWLEVYKNDKLIVKLDERLTIEAFIDFLINKHNDYDYVPDFFFEYKGTELEWYEFSMSFEEFIDYMRNEQKNNMIGQIEVCLETSENCCVGKLEDKLSQGDEILKELETTEVTYTETQVKKLVNNIESTIVEKWSDILKTDSTIPQLLKDKIMETLSKTPDIYPMYEKVNEELENCGDVKLHTIENAEQEVKELEDKVFEAYKHILDDSIAPKMPKDLKISFINYIADYSTGESIKSRLMKFCGLSEELESKVRPLVRCAVYDHNFGHQPGQFFIPIDCEEAILPKMTNDGLKVGERLGEYYFDIQFLEKCIPLNCRYNDTNQIYYDNSSLYYK